LIAKTEKDTRKAPKRAPPGLTAGKPFYDKIHLCFFRDNRAYSTKQTTQTAAQITSRASSTGDGFDETKISVGPSAPPIIAVPS
jgi:hypothetical protein